MARDTYLTIEIGRAVLVGLGRIGGRAAASAAKSVMQDGRRFAEQVQERIDYAQKRIDDMINGPREEDDARGRRR